MLGSCCRFQVAWGPVGWGVSKTRQNYLSRALAFMHTGAGEGACAASMQGLQKLVAPSMSHIAARAGLAIPAAGSPFQQHPAAT